MKPPSSYQLHRQRLEALLESRPFVHQLIVRGGKTLATIRQVYQQHKLGLQLTFALRSAKIEVVEHRRTQGQLCPYFTRGGRLYRVVITKDGAREERVANFAPIIEQELVLDDGVCTHRELVVTALHETGIELPAVHISPSELSTNWPLTRWGSRAVVEAAAKALEHVRVAMQHFSEPEEVHAYAHTGWVVHKGKDVFLHAGGGVGAPEATVHLDQTINRYRLPAATEDASDAIRRSADLLDITRLNVSAPLLAAVYRAPIADLLPCDFTIFVVGPSGAFKSTLLALAMAHYGTFEHTSLPQNWESTANALENYMFAAKDVLQTIDDYAPGSTHRMDETRRKGDRVFRQVGNLVGRGRMTANLTQRPDRPPRGLVVATGEDLPAGISVNARLYTLRVDSKDDTDQGALTKAQAAQHRLPHAMRAYIEWLAPKRTLLRERLPRRFEALRQAFMDSYGHLRLPAATANLAIGIELFYEFALDHNVMTKAEAAHQCANAIEALKRNVEVAEARQVTLNPVNQFMQVLHELMLQGRVRLRDVNDSLSTEPGITDIGWRGKKKAFILPGPTYATVGRAMRSSDDELPIRRDELWTRMRAQGLLARGDKGRFDKKISLGPKDAEGKRSRPRVLVMPLSALDGKSIDSAAGKRAPAAGQNTSAMGQAPNPAGQQPRAPLISSEQKQGVEGEPAPLAPDVQRAEESRAEDAVVQRLLPPQGGTSGASGASGASCASQRSNGNIQTTFSFDIEDVLGEAREAGGDA